jgi:TatD DNase family protein
MQWIDIGANLTHESFSADREVVIEHARQHGVVQIIVTGASIDSSTAALELTRAHPGMLFATAGVHPHHAEQLQQSHLSQLQALLAEPNVVAVGECGLDYYRNLSAPEAQRRAFQWQLRLAADSRKPVFLHQRDAHEDFVALLREHRSSLVGGVAHCFTAGERELEDYLQLELSIGITGWINDERRGAHLSALMPRIPPHRLLLETDAPYLMPRDLAPRPRSRRNEPRFLPHIGAAVARARGESPQQCAAHTTAHARQLFGLPDAVMIP